MTPKADLGGPDARPVWVGTILNAAVARFPDRVLS
jgi:hypothetical protein